MKNIFLILLALFLLGKLPAKNWDASTEEQKKDFMKVLVNEYGQKFECQKAKLHAFRNADEIYFFLECEKGKKASVSENSFI